MSWGRWLAGLWLFSWLLLVAGCGARSSMAGAPPAQAGYGGPMAKMDTDADGMADQADAEEPMAESAPPPPAPPSPAAMPGSVSATGGGAPPVARAPVPVAKDLPGKKMAEFRERGEKPAEPGAPASTGQKPAVAAQLLVYTADLHLRVQQVPKAIDAIEKLAKERGGYLVVRQDNRITVRVPSAKFDAALDDLVRLGDLVHRNVSIEDVTDLYFDLQTRMKNLEVVQKRLEELLEKAKTVEESLAVQRQLERVTVELERLRGKLKLLAELVMFSTITVVLEPKSTEQIDSKVRLPFPWMDRLGLGELLRL